MRFCMPLCIALLLCLFGCDTAPKGGSSPDVGPGSDTAQLAVCPDIPTKGCCNGRYLLWCDSGIPREIDCGSSTSCGWNSQIGEYDCATDGQEDPAGVHPMMCAGAVPPGQDISSNADVVIPREDGVSEDVPISDGGDDCVIACTKKDCGQIGDCSCGDCGAGKICEAFKCVADSDQCVAICEGLECGTFDDCDCGSCPTGWQCGEGYQCYDPCAGRECGPDGFGGNCGNCTAGLLCEEGNCIDPLLPDTVDFSAGVEGFGMGGQLVSGVTVELFNNTSGMSTGIIQMSDEDGWVVFENLKNGNLYGFKCALNNFKPTFAWDIEAIESNEERIWIVPNAVYQMALGLAGLTQQPGNSVALGAVHWKNGTGEDEAIGCATVTSSPETGDVRYMSSSNGLPTTLQNQPCTAAMATEGNGRFIVANLPPGQVSMTAWDNEGEEIGSALMWAVGDSVAVTSIDAFVGKYQSNPGPSGCDCQP